MNAVWSALSAGLLFGFGLGIAGMTRADKVIAFLDLGDGWDPSLAFVMGGAIAVHVLLYRLILRRASPLFTSTFRIPSRADIDTRLVAGSALFGIGWGLGGYCPGPGIVSLGSGSQHALVFVTTATLGMALVQFIERRVRPTQTATYPGEPLS